jgi:hypothetical protein
MTMHTNRAALDELRQDFTGEIIVPDDPAYAEASGRGSHGGGCTSQALSTYRMACPTPTWCAILVA